MGKKVSKEKRREVLLLLWDEEEEEEEEDTNVRCAVVQEGWSNASSYNRAPPMTKIVRLVASDSASGKEGDTT